MSQLGIGAMLANLGGNEESARTFKEAIGRTIKQVALAADGDGDNQSVLRITFDDGPPIELFDDGQSCCEQRYMHTDDDLSHFVGAKLLGASVEDGEEKLLDYGDHHDSEFLKVDTSRGTFTVVNYNDHNGYYGGFALRCRAGE